MARKGKPNATPSATAPSAAPPTKYSTAELAAYSRGFAEGRRAGIKYERERLADRGGFLRLPEVLKLTGLSRATLWRLERRGLFPLRVQLAENAVGWPEAALRAWVADRPFQEDADWLASLSDEERERARRGELGLFRIYEPPAARRRPSRRPE